MITGNVAKMLVKADEQGKVEYTLPIGDTKIGMNAYIGRNISVETTGVINCKHCGRVTKKSFSQGYCFVCMKKLAQCDTCIIKPELCHYDQGTCREPQWGEQNCLQPHMVYLSNTGQLKVGITRNINTAISTRWIDQGATQAIPLFMVKQRLISGQLEVEIAKTVGDKTNWRTMLKGAPEAIDLTQKRNEIHEKMTTFVDMIHLKFGDDAVSYSTLDQQSINYPVNVYPHKIKSINLDKEPSFSGTLQGIKGQYLLLDNDRVINIRKYTGYEWNIEV